MFHFLAVFYLNASNFFLRILRILSVLVKQIFVIIFLLGVASGN